MNTLSVRDNEFGSSAVQAISCRDDVGTSTQNVARIASIVGRWVTAAKHGEDRADGHVAIDIR